jgi:PAS domain S-box-containing protein
MDDRYTILLVDDSESDRGIYRRYLLADKVFDYQIIEAESLEEGLELWRSESPDLVLVDIHLPDGSGLELLEAIAETASERKTPFIAITGQGDERIAVQAMKLGARDYLVKEDITATVLSYCVENAVRKKTQQELQRFNQALEHQVEQQILSLQASQKINRTILETIPDLLLHLHSDGTVLDQIRSKTGNFNNFLPISTNISEILPPDLLTKQLQVIQQAIATRELQVYEHDFLKNGRTHYEEVRVMPINDQEVLVIVRDISDRKVNELKLKESQQFLQTVLDTFPLSVFWKDRQSVYLGCNQNFANDANVLSPSQIIGKTDDGLPWEKDEVNFYRADDIQVMNSGIAKLNIEETITLQTGERRYVETNKIPLRNLNNEIIGVLGTYQDISDRKQAELQLQKISDRLAIALNSGAIGSWEWDLVNNIAFWDERMYELYGVDKKSNSLTECEILATALHPDDRNSVETLLQQAILGEAEYNTEFRIVHSDGSIHFIKGYGVVVRDDQGKPQSMIGVNFDISDRKQAEAETEEFNRRWRSVLDNLQMIVIEVNKGGNVQYINSFYLTISGFNLEEVIGKH